MASPYSITWPSLRAASSSAGSGACARAASGAQSERSTANSNQRIGTSFIGSASSRGLLAADDTVMQRHEMQYVIGAGRWRQCPDHVIGDGQMHQTKIRQPRL